MHTMVFIFTKQTSFGTHEIIREKKIKVVLRTICKSDTLLLPTKALLTATAIVDSFNVCIKIHYSFRYFILQNK
jgi:hypothetical protein